MKFFDIIRRSGRNLRQAKVRTLLTACALAVGGFTLTLTLAATEGARAYADRLISSNFDPAALMVAKDDAIFGAGAGSLGKPQEYDPTAVSLGGNGLFLIKRLTQQDISKLEDMEGVESVNIQYQLAAQFITREGAKKYTASLSDFTTAAKPEAVGGALPSELGTGEILLPEAYVGLLGFNSARDAVNKQATIQIAQPTGKTRADTYRVAAVVRPATTNLDFEPARILVSDEDAASTNAFVNAGTPSANQYLNAFVNVRDGENEAKLLAVKERIVQAGFAAQTMREAQASLGQIIEVLQIIILVFGAVTLIASFFGVVNTQYISVLERTREIGLMKALGMRRSTVSWLFIVEATWIGFLGGLIGSAAAVGLGVVLNPFISEQLNFGDSNLLVFQPLHIAGLIAFLMLATTIAGLLPARKAARLDPIEALRTE